MIQQDEEIIADYDIRSPASRTFLTVLGTIVAVAIVIGLVLGASVLMRSTTVSTSDVELEGSARLVIDAGTADLRIVRGDPGVVRISARVTSGLRKTDFQVGRKGDQIKILGTCQTWLNPGCGVEATVALPEGLPVYIRTTSGDVLVRDVAEGVLNIRTGSGDIAGRGLELDEFEGATVSGDISATFATQPFGFKATSDTGDVSARMAGGKRTYVVSATSESGKVSSDVESDPDGEGFVRVRTASGDVSLTSD
jgi:hypothetical protein